jgi:hypothetical protein
MLKKRLNCTHLCPISYYTYTSLALTHDKGLKFVYPMVKNKCYYYIGF